jgi:hypothetical protein
MIILLKKQTEGLPINGHLKYTTEALYNYYCSIQYILHNNIFIIVGIDIHCSKMFIDKNDFT